MNGFKGIYETLRRQFDFKDKSKVIQNTAIIIIIGIIIVIAGGAFTSDEGKPAASNTSQEDYSKDNTVNAKNELESRVAEILSQIEGVGTVDIMITFESEKELVPAYDTRVTGNETQQKDSEGGVSSSIQSDTEKKIVYEEVGGVKKPVYLKEIMPAVKGVVVVAQGARSIAVKDQVVKAIQVLLDVQPHKIQVFEKSINSKDNINKQK